MELGSGQLGSGQLGSTPDPDEFEQQSGDEKDEDYRDLYEEVQELKGDIQENKEQTDRWRRRSWKWRVGSFLIGNLSGVLVSNFWLV